MLYNYILLSVRNILKQRGYAVVNTLGLAIGLSSAIFILLYVRDELTFDTMHPKANSTYRMGYWLQYPNGQEEKFPAVPAGWDNFIKDNYEGVGDIASYLQFGMPTSMYYAPSDKTVLTEEILWAEPTLSKLIAINLVKGDQETALLEPNSIMLSETAAYKLFGKEDPLNKMIGVTHQQMTNNKRVEMMVKGVYKDFPSNSHIAPQYIANIYTLKPFIPELEKAMNESMGDGNNGMWSQSYFTCTNAESVPIIQEALQKKANEIIERLKLDLKFRPIITKITDVHFDKEIDWSVYHKSGDKNYMYIFITIALLILLVASINYINLAVAKSVTRAKEIGLRKTFGGQRSELFLQFMLESFILVFIAVIIAITIVIILLPQFNTLSEKTFTIRHLMEPGMLLIIGAVMLFVTLVGGSYPALFISSFDPAAVLKGKFAFRKGSNVFRQFLIGLQFGVAVVLLIGSVILVRQMDLMRNSKLNEAGKQIVSIRYGGFGSQASDMLYNTYKNIVLQNPKITAVTLANHLPRLDYFGPINMRFQFPEIKEEQFEWFQLNGDYDFPKTFGLKIIAGRDFDAQNTSDSTAIIINEAAVKALKLTPENAIGKSVTRPAHSYYGGPDSAQAPVYGKVIGVVEDFPYKSMNNKIDPLGIAGRPHFDDRIIHVRIGAKNMGEEIQFLEKSWKKVFPSLGFDYWFVDDEFGRMYENETKISGLTEKFSALAIFITCIGLYGLASFMAQQRVREIGIRKALGSSSGQILFLLLSVFAKLLLISSLMAVPITYFLTSKWLERFAYQTPLSPLLFAASLLLISVITLFTVGFETWRAAKANPVESLRHD